MDKEEKWKIMKTAVDPIIKMLDERLNGRLDALTTLANSSLDSVPESVKIKREEEAAKIRAIVQEQRDIIATLKLLYPDA